jgi:phosphinothricin acetyltransferase
MEKPDCNIRDASPGDAAEIARIYNHYIANTIISFEENTVSADSINERISGVQAAGLPWLVAEQDGSVLGYCYAGRWHGRSAYRYSTEVAVYLNPDHAGKGLGSELYSSLLPAMKARKIHTAIAVIALPNDTSIKLHEKMGFKKAAHFQEVGFKFDRWIDVGYWQCIL